MIGTNTAKTVSRPLCPYPKVARYTGSGDVNSAASFDCVDTTTGAVTHDQGEQGEDDDHDGSHLAGDADHDDHHSGVHND